MRQTLRILSIAAIPVDVHVSWLAICALITWSLAVGYFPAVLGAVPAFAYWASGLLASLLLFVSVLLHELSHAFVARAHGLSVHGITLHVFGGVSQLAGEPPSPRAEFLIAVVGPLTSFGLAAVLWGLRALELLDPVGRAIVSYLVVVNLAVGIFNLVPGFPLDGGRVLRAALWKWRGSLDEATRIASRVGSAFALGLVALGIVEMLAGASLEGVWLILLGLFLHGAAGASYAQIALKAALGSVRVRDMMTTEVVSVPPDATIGELADALWSRRVTSVPVVDRDIVRGIASLDHARGVARDRWLDTRVSDVMRGLSDDLVVGPDDPALDALRKASSNGVGRLAVVERMRLVGYLSLKDITHLVALEGLPARQERTRGSPRRAA